MAKKLLLALLCTLAWSLPAFALNPWTAARLITNAAVTGPVVDDECHDE